MRRLLHTFLPLLMLLLSLAPASHEATGKTLAPTPGLPQGHKSQSGYETNREPQVRSTVPPAVPSHTAAGNTLPGAPAACARPPFQLARGSALATLVVEPTAHRSVLRCAGDLRDDISRVTGRPPALLGGIPPLEENVVLVATLGESPLADGLISSGKLDTRKLEGRWEASLTQVVEAPWPGVARALVILGADRRGTIFSCYDLSASIGVSPWHWWADVPVARRDTLTLDASPRLQGSPSVRYRGIFLNDEDWALQPWAAKTLEPETGDIGPRTYARICELLLRLKANTLWPAMHACTRAFNRNPRNREVAADHGIIMGSSHAEPMLRNNVDEWTAPKGDFNFITNPGGVSAYWEERVRQNGSFENIYTLGMRGIHDSAMVGPRDDPERIATLERIFEVQRALLRRHVNERLELVPQAFCVYKEVLDLHRQGLKVPDDVTLVWPDDNFGYVRNFASPSERSRSGSFGVYYHLSYLGAPLSYLWLDTIPPALLWEEMHKAYEHGADRIWIVNVGDLKPAEHTTELFLQMAWDITRWTPSTLPRFLPECAARDFGPEHASEIGEILAENYRLNFQRKPEHLQWWLPGTPRVHSPLTDAEVETRLATFAQLRHRVSALRARIPASHQDAFYQLVYYPVSGAALANIRFLEGERGNLAIAREADVQLHAETRFYNEEMSGGKWRHYMALEPAGKPWLRLRLEPWAPPPLPRPSIPAPAPGSYLSLAASRHTAQRPSGPYAWTVIPGLGRECDAITVLPTTHASLDAGSLEQDAAAVSYALTVPRGGDLPVAFHVLPTHPLGASGSALRLGFALDAQKPSIAELQVKDGDANWGQGVLNGSRQILATLRNVTPGKHTLTLFAVDPGLVLEKIVIDLGGLAPSYLGPPVAP